MRNIFIQREYIHKKTKTKKEKLKYFKKGKKKTKNEKRESCITPFFCHKKMKSAHKNKTKRKKHT